MKNTDELKTGFANWIDKALEDHDQVKSLKTALVNSKQYELAADLRDYEVEKFAISDEQKAATKLGTDLNTLFRMVQLNVPAKEAWLLFKASMLYKDMGGDVSLMDTSRIEAEANKYFD